MQATLITNPEDISAFMTAYFGNGRNLQYAESVVDTWSSTNINFDDESGMIDFIITVPGDYIEVANEDYPKDGGAHIPSVTLIPLKIIVPLSLLQEFSRLGRSGPSVKRGRFPLDENVDSYLEFPGRFADPRDEGNRGHAGCDLYAPVGTKVFAVKSGIVIQNPYAFNTKFDFAIEINHGDFIGRYCEIIIADGLGAGSNITQGQLIGTVAKMPGHRQTMLHFEMYSGNGTGPLTNRANLPYMRRSDLIDPTHFLIFGY